MTGPRITVAPEGLERVTLTLKVGETLVDDLSPVYRQAAAIAAGATEDAFARESTPDGKPWAPLALSTQGKIVAKGKRRGAHPILQVSGQMAASVHTAFDKQSATIGTNKVQAALMQVGGVAGRSSPSRNTLAGQRARSRSGRSSSRDFKPFQRPQIPARAFIGLGASHLGEIEKRALAYFAKKLGG